MWTRIMSASLLVCLMSGLAVSQPSYVVTDLGVLSPTGLNDWGQVVGNYNNAAYLWTLGRRHALGKLSGGTFSSAAAINDVGEVTGTADGPATIVGSAGTQECSDVTQPFLWTLRTGMQGLGTLGAPEDGIISHWCDDPYYGTAINIHGEVVGHDVDEHLFDYQWAFTWTKSGGMTLFGGSWPPTFANGINFQSQIVGDTAYSLDLEICCLIGLAHATSWKDSVATDLETLGGEAPDFASSATGINDSGQIVGWSTIGPVPGNDESIGYFGSLTHAVLWETNGEIQDLGTLNGDTLSAALKINIFGQVIGSSGSTALPFDFFNDYEVTGRPFIWTRQSGMRDLNALIPASSEWVLTTATDINFWGQIVGEGTKNGQTHGYLLTPRTPFPVF